MAEVGLVRFAQVALDVAAATVPRYRTAFSKHQFTQPQLLAILCLMRYEDWTYREAEVRLAEHSELRRALRLRSVPDYTTLYRFLRRLDEAAIARCLNEVVRCLKLPRGPTPCPGDHRCHRAGSRRGQHLLRTPHVSPHPTTAAVAALVEMAGRRRPEAATHLGAVGTAGPVE
jgi:hypothetical protein